jgi:hypothetical protein
LQISETIVLQRVELEGKPGSSHCWVFEAVAVLMGKHGFAEKLHLKLKSLSDVGGAFSEVRGTDSTKCQGCKLKA